MSIAATNGSYSLQRLLIENNLFYDVAEGHTLRES